MNVIFRYSYLSAVIAGAKNETNTYGLSHYVRGNIWEEVLLNMDLNIIPSDYDGDNYDLIFDEGFKFVKASRELWKD